MCLLAADRELPEEHEDLPECLEKPQSPDLQRGKISPSPGESRTKTAEKEEKEVRLILKCYLVVFRGADLPHPDCFKFDGLLRLNRLWIYIRF